MLNEVYYSKLAFAVGPRYPKSELVSIFWGHRGDMVPLEEAIAIRDQLDEVIGKVDRGRDEAALEDEPPYPLRGKPYVDEGDEACEVWLTEEGKYRLSVEEI